MVFGETLVFNCHFNPKWWPLFSVEQPPIRLGLVGVAMTVPIADPCSRAAGTKSVS